MNQLRATFIDFNQAVDRYFDDSSLCLAGSPRAVILMGGVAAGKTTIRKQKYSQGYVLIDAAQIFLDLSRGEVLDFPDAFADELELIGRFVAQRAITERRHIVTEIIGDDPDSTIAMIEALMAAGYVVDVVGVHCELQTSIDRANSRTEDHISAYYTGPMNARWIVFGLT